MPEKNHRRFALSDIARIGVFSALAFAANAPFLVIPNVEIFTLILFLSGVFLGIIDGLGVAIVAGIIFVFFNPNGPQTIFIVGLAQLLGFVLYGLAGGVLRQLVLHYQNTRGLMLLMAICGASLTLWYDITTNLAFAVVIGPFWPTLVGGMGYGIIHLISNTVIFAFSSLIINRIWKRIGYLLPPVAIY
ncbi:MAG TPA: hypothetical protein DEO84_07380 [candidate division Zixibacteria bacterium]|nr:hypothetical protein [candidate division Zixibacteria bacterium]